MKSNGFATILLMIPVLTVPALAIFGIPQFAPVVASPLEESEDHDRETRVGTSARNSRDGAFDDIEGFNSAQPLKNGAASRLRKGNSSRNENRDDAGRRSSDEANSAWGDDLETGSDWPGNSRRAPPSELDDSGDPDRSPVDRNLQTLSGRNIPQRYERRSRRTGNSSNSSQSASADEADQGVVQAGFVDESPEPKPRRASPGNRSRTPEPRNSVREETGPETATNALTWAAAVERLNEYDIRNFRLEPGDRSGQFVFICTYASPDAPSVSYRFEAGADEPLKAVEKVLEQIVAWRQKQ